MPFITDQAKVEILEEGIIFTHMLIIFMALDRKGDASIPTISEWH
jgi:hypothetical protein